MFDIFLDLLFPPHCVNCGRGGTGPRAVCDDCLRAVRLHSSLFCARCGARLAENRRICHRDSPYLLGAACDYSDPTVRELILALKFKGLSPAARPLAELLLRYSEGLRILTGREVIVPLPLGPRRLRERGYNQAEEIALIFGKGSGLPVSNVLERSRETRPQTDLGAEERERNLSGCFRLRETPPKATVILLDDVTTSGATLREAALALKRGGVRRVIALTVAKA